MRALLAHVAAGGDLLLYGPLEPDSVPLDQLGVALAEPLEGDFRLLGEDSRLIRHTATFSGGAWREIPFLSEGDAIWSVPARLHSADRLAGLARRTPSGGRWAWLRGSLTTSEYDPSNPQPILGPLLKPLPRSKFFPSERLAVTALEALGWSFQIERQTEEARAPFTVLHRHRNAVIAGNFFPSPHATVRMRTPLGAPLFISAFNEIKAGHTIVPHQPACQRECRWFLDGQLDGNIRVRLLHPGMPDVKRRYLLSGLEDATIHFLPEPGNQATLQILQNPIFPYSLDDVLPAQILDSPWGPLVTLPLVSGELLFEW